MPMDIRNTVTTAATPDLTQSLRNTGKNERPDCKGQFARIATFAAGPRWNVANHFAELLFPPAGRDIKRSRQAGHDELLIRRSLGFVVRRALLQNVDQVAASFRYASLFTSHDVFCLDRMAINVCARVIVGTKR